jgi:predicted RNA-binding Zn-ribbon protein involved in translation (DUF1610 family)
MSSVTVACPKCSNVISMAVQDTKVVQSFVLCSKCGYLWRVR